MQSKLERRWDLANILSSSQFHQRSNIAAWLTFLRPHLTMCDSVHTEHTGFKSRGIHSSLFPYRSYLKVKALTMFRCRAILRYSTTFLLWYTVFYILTRMGHAQKDTVGPESICCISRCCGNVLIVHIKALGEYLQMSFPSKLFSYILYVSSFRGS